MSTEFKTLEIKKSSPNVGAEISGVDLSREVSDAQFAEIRRANDAYGVIFFRDQELTPDQHLAFARRWGGINVNRFFAQVEGYPEIAEVRKEPDQKLNIGGRWHTDHSYDQVPAFGSVLYALDVPDVGGDTVFAGMSAAYEGLSDGLKKTLLGLNAVHSSRHVFGQQRHIDGEGDIRTRLANPDLATQDSVHPTVITHPRTGRKSLFVNPQFTTHFEGWTAEESQPLIDVLTAHTTQEEYLCRFKWTNGALAIWNNMTTWHRAVNDYHGTFRLMHRITIEGQSCERAAAA